MRILIFFLVFVCTCTGCISSRRFAEKFMNPEAFPKDLKSANYTLLIMQLEYDGTDQRTAKAYANYAEKISKFAAGLPFPAIAITKQDLASGRYNDVNKYRYVIQPYDKTSTVRSTTYTQRTPGGGYLDGSVKEVIYMELYFTDRKENRAYPSTNYKTDSYLFGLKKAMAKYEL